MDVVVAGRYPHDLFPGWVPGERRSVDVMDADSGAMLAQLTTPGTDKIISLNRFAPAGDALLSGMGQTVLVWRQRPVVEAEESKDLFREKESNLKNLLIEEWPEFKPIKPSGKRKKLKD